MALAALCAKAELDVMVLDLPDGRVPAHWTRAKDALEALRLRCDPDLILAPAPHDAHQDHRTLAKLVPTVFRAHQALGYEILKRSEEHTSELQSRENLVCRLLLEKKNEK